MHAGQGLGWRFRDSPAPAGVNGCQHITADVEFARRDWAQENLHQAQHFGVGQVHGTVNHCWQVAKANRLH